MPLLPNQSASTFLSGRAPALLGMLLLCGPVSCGDSGGERRSESATPAPPSPARPRAAATARPRPPSVQVRPSTWGRKVALLADRHSLAQGLARQGRRPHARSMALVARLEPGLGGPAFRYYSLGDSGFQYSPKRFYPASTVKLVAAVGALLTLRKHGFTGSAYIRLKHGDSLIQRPVYRMLKDAVEHSSNSAYDRLVLVAGFDALNRDHLGPHRGLPDMAIQSSFYGAEVRTSPGFRLREGSRSRWFPRRKGRYVNPRCPEDKNCVNLLGLQEVLRRVMLHHELPPAHRFGIHEKDIARLNTYLRRHRSRLSPQLSKTLGHPVTVWNTVGWVPKYDYLENALAKDLQTGERYLLAVSVPMAQKDVHAPKVELKLGKFGAAVLKALRAAPRRGPPLQPDAGPPMTVQAAAAGGGRTLRLSLGVTGADAVRGWLGRRALPPPRAEGATAGKARYVVELPMPAPGHHVLVLQPTRGGAPVAYRSFVLEVRRHHP